MKKKKLNKIPTHNAIIGHYTDNKDVSAGVRYSSEEKDKNLYKDVLGGHDNGIFADNKIVLGERKWIWISGKGIWASPWLIDTEMKRCSLAIDEVFPVPEKPHIAMILTMSD